jgi:ParB family chromosome partitioning protein
MIERRLGRGLETLISRTSTDQDRQVFDIPLDAIRANPDQPRSVMGDEALDGLARSIRTHGVLQPIIVQRRPDGYQLVAGERRLRASRLAGRATVPAIVIEAEGDRSLELALIENLQREDLGALDEAAAYEALLGRMGLTHDELGERLGKSRSTITNSLRLLELPAEVQRLVRAGNLSAGQARAILGAGSDKAMIDLAAAAANGSWSVREVERRVKDRRNGGDRRRAGSRENSKKGDKYTEELRLLYGTKVTIQDDGGRGRVSLEFYSDADRDRLLHLLLVGGRAASDGA